MALSAAQAQIADAAIAKVETACRDAQTALDNESGFLTWATGSESARTARENDLVQSQKILAQLRAKRLILTDDSEMAGFLDLATAGADMTALQASSARMTAAGFKAEVVDPTLAAVNPLNLSGPVGQAMLLLLGLGLVLIVIHLTND
jgi:hypothetical protein